MKRFTPLTSLLFLFMMFGWAFAFFTYKLSTDYDEVTNKYSGGGEVIYTTRTNYKTGVTGFAIISSVCFISAALVAVKTNNKPQV